ncbi:MAG: hypothetical protein ACRDHN_18400, partial [Thermomicrobiales bacterium]
MEESINPDDPNASAAAAAAPLRGISIESFYVPISHDSAGELRFYGLTGDQFERIAAMPADVGDRDFVARVLAMAVRTSGWDTSRFSELNDDVLAHFASEFAIHRSVSLIEALD